jgi:hypothetical protein
MVACFSWLKLGGFEMYLKKSPLYFFLGVAILIAALLFRFPYEFHRLLFSTSNLAAIDLIQRYNEVQFWFAGESVYSLMESAVYPPASYLIMWPFIGFASWTIAKWMWAVSSIILLVFIIRVLLRENTIDNPRQQILWTFFIAAHYATGTTIGNGQLTIHIMAAILGSIVLLSTPQHSWSGYLLIGFFAALSLVKPTTAVPFMWLILWVPGNIYPALATTAIYGALALISSSWQSTGILQLHLDWFALGTKGATWGSKSMELSTIPSSIPLSIPLSIPSSIPSTFSSESLSSSLRGDVGYGDIHSLLGALGMNDWAIFASLTLLAFIGIWSYFHRHCNIWILLGVTAIVSRIWAYHRVYDDMIIIFAIFGVIATLKLEMNSNQRFGNLLLKMLVVASLIPASLRLLPTPLDLFFKFGQLSLWMVTLFWLVHAASLEKQTKAYKKNSKHCQQKLYLNRMIFRR